MTVEKLKALDPRIPAWNLDELQLRNCPFCESSEYYAFAQRPDTLSVNKCRKCSCYYVSPAPSDDAIEKFYADYHSSHFVCGLEISKFVETVQSCPPYDSPVISFLIENIVVKNSKILDIGCGKGGFLYRVKNLGADVFGLDVNKEAVEFCAKIGLHNVICGSFSNFPVKHNYFDVVTLNDLIEHPLTPLDLMEKSINALKVGGFLVIWTPNGDRINHDPEKITLRKDLEHMQYLTSKTAQLLCERFHLSLFHYEVIGFPSTPWLVTRGSASNIIRRKITSASRMIGVYRFGRRFLRLLNAHRPRNSPKGDYQVLCVFKKVALSSNSISFDHS